MATSKIPKGLSKRATKVSRQPGLGSAKMGTKGTTKKGRQAKAPKNGLTLPVSKPIGDLTDFDE